MFCPRFVKAPISPPRELLFWDKCLSLHTWCTYVLHCSLAILVYVYVALRLSKIMQMHKHVEIILVCGAELDSDRRHPSLYCYCVLMWAVYMCARIEGGVRALVSTESVSVPWTPPSRLSRRLAHAHMHARTQSIVTCPSLCALHASWRSRTAADSSLSTSHTHAETITHTHRGRQRALERSAGRQSHRNPFLSWLPGGRVTERVCLGRVTRGRTASPI